MTITREQAAEMTDVHGFPFSLPFAAGQTSITRLIALPGAERIEGRDKIVSTEDTRIAGQDAGPVLVMRTRTYIPMNDQRPVTDQAADFVAQAGEMGYVGAAEHLRMLAHEPAKTRRPFIDRPDARNLAVAASQQGFYDLADYLRRFAD